MYKRNNLLITIILLLLFKVASAQQNYTIHMLDNPPIKSIRGMSAVNDSVLWVAGTGGKAGITTNGGKSWQWITVPGYDTCDWRTLYAFSKERALLLNAGEPAAVVLTTNGGKTWKRVYFNDSKGVFFDGMTFKNSKEGIAIGDPINGKFTIIYTHDGGLSWQADTRQEQPAAQSGEAIFAASNSSITKLPDGNVCFVSGGSASHFFKGWHQWQSVDWPMTQGSAGKGAFSVAFFNQHKGIAAGGDYTNDTSNYQNCLLTEDGGLHWEKPIVSPGGYRSCVKYISEKVLIATGTAGTDISEDGGRHWINISDKGFHAIAVSPSGKNIWLAGSRKMATLVVSGKK